MSFKAWCHPSDRLANAGAHLEGGEYPSSLGAGDVRRLDRLAAAAAATLPRTADFLAREIARAKVVPPGFILNGVVVMGSEVEFLDDVTGQAPTVNLVYPNEADLKQGKLSVLSPVGAALIGLSVGQSIEWETPTGGWRSLTVLSVGDVKSAPELGREIREQAGA